MTYDALKARFPNASEEFLRRNASDCAQDRRAPSAPVAEQAVRDAALGAVQRKASDTGSVPCGPAFAGRVRVTVRSYRRFLLDPDNLAGGAKYFLDCCRFASLIRDDRPQDIEFSAVQTKVARKEEERTEITIEPLSDSTP